MRLSTGSEHLPKTNLICAFQHHLFQELFVHYCPTSKYVDFHEVNCYSNWCTLHKMTIATFNSPHAFHNYAPHESVVSAHSDHITLVITECYQLTHMIPPPPATTLMLPGIHSIEFLDGCYFVHAPPATF